MGGERSPYRPWSRWNLIRQQILERDGRTCQIGTHCNQEPEQANHVDHIVGWRTEGGAWHDPANLRAACQRCNSGRSSSQRRDWQDSDTDIVLVMRSAFADVHPEPFDLIVDVERFTAAVAAGGVVNSAHRQAASAAFHALVRRLERGTLDADRVWVVVDSTEAAATVPHHSLITGHDDEGDNAAEGPRPVEAGRW